MALVYQPRMELEEVNNDGDIETRFVWQDWGVFDSEDEACDVAEKIQQQIDEGYFDDRCTTSESGLTMCVEVIEDNGNWELKEIIEL